MLRKRLTTAAPVLNAAWCFFQNTGPDAILCLLHPGALSVYTQDGDSHIVPLPGHFSRLWPLPQGVLLTVSCLSAYLPAAPGVPAGRPSAVLELVCVRVVPPPQPNCDHHLMHCAAVYRAVQGSAVQGPCILVHPLENIQEVQQQVAPERQQQRGGGGGFWDEAEQVVWSGSDVPYLVTHNTVRRAVCSSRESGRTCPAPCYIVLCGGGREPCVRVAGGRLLMFATSCSITHLSLPHPLQRHGRLALWSITTQRKPQGFVAVTPMHWPGGGGSVGSSADGTAAPHTPANANLPPPPTNAASTGGGGATLASTPTGGGLRSVGGAGGTAHYK